MKLENKCSKLMGLRVFTYTGDVTFTTGLIKSDSLVVTGS